MSSCVIGQYNQRGYTVYVLRNGELIEKYHAGNHPLDSGAVVQPGYGLSLGQIRTHCVHTTKDIAEELHQKYGGVEREEED